MWSRGWHGAKGLENHILTAVRARARANVPNRKWDLEKRKKVTGQSAGVWRGRDGAYRFLWVRASPHNNLVLP